MAPDSGSEVQLEASQLQEVILAYALVMQVASHAITILAAKSLQEVPLCILSMPLLVDLRFSDAKRCQKQGGHQASIDEALSGHMSTSTGPCMSAPVCCLHMQQLDVPVLRASSGCSDKLSQQTYQSDNFGLAAAAP